MAKKGRIKIEMRSTESPHFYTTTKSPLASKKLEMMKFDPILQRHVMYKEGKIRK